MALQRVPIPSPNYSSSRARNRLLVLHTSEGATTFQSLGNFLANPSAEVSYHVGFDNTTRDAVGEFVKPPNKSWSAHSANNEGEHGCFCVPSGAANGWSRNDWLARDLMLDAAAAWLREESARYGVPLVRITPSQIAAGASGVCDHNDCVDAGLGGTHVDVGNGFPWDVVLGGATPEPEPEVVEMWVLDGVCPPGESRERRGTVRLGIPHGFKSARVDLYIDADPSAGASVYAAVNLDGKNHGLWSSGNTWEMWVPGRKVVAATLPGGARGVIVQHFGGVQSPVLVTVSGT